MSKHPIKDRQHARLILEELEERRLFSGGIEGLIDSGADAGAIYRDAAEPSDKYGDAAADATDAEYRTRELVFVDTRVEDYEALVDSLAQGSDRSHQIEVVVLERERDGIEQISAALESYDNLDAVHIISHGSDGSIQLGGGILDADTLEQNQAAIALWANAFAETGDILIYGCNLAASEAGQSLIGDLAGLTLTDVAASDDLTGQASLGGDWELEHAVGTIEADVVIAQSQQQQWQGLLASFTVDTLADTTDANPGNGVAEDASGNTSIRAAIEEANALGGSNDITVGAGAFTLGLGEITISSDITITGAGVGVTIIDGAAASRIFDITGGSVTFSNLTIQNGNSATTGGAMDIAPGATVAIDNVEFIGNTGILGGAINNAGILILTDVTIDNNTATSDAGAIFNSGNATLTNVTISNNTGNSNAGGIWTEGNATTLNATNVTFSGNSTPGDGGALYVHQTATQLTNVTITDNSASQGAGIHETGGPADATLTNTIVAGNKDTLGNPAADVSGNYISGGNNLIGDSGSVNDFTDGVNGDQVGDNLAPLDPLLGALADNGGATMTHDLLAGSTAIDAGNSVAAPATDQRGDARSDGRADIGAYEVFDPTPDPNIVTVTTSNDIVNGDVSNIDALLADDGGDGISLREAILAANATTNVGGQADIIEFSIGTGAVEIAWDGVLPEITDAVFIDGTTQGGYAGDPLVELDGSSGGFLSARLIFRPGSDGSTLKGVSITSNMDAIVLESDNNTIQGNWIGVNTSGAAEDNYGDGIQIKSSGNIIGGVGPGEANVIANANTLAAPTSNGINVVSGSNNVFRANLIYGNDELGIDLGSDGVTLNDADDVDVGANQLQNTPDLSAASINGGNLFVAGMLDSSPSTTYEIDFYWSPAGDGSGHGEASNYLGAVSVTTDASGVASFSQTFAGAPPGGSIVTATATGPDGTSEFAANINVTVNAAPDITSDGGLATAAVNVAENTTAVTTVTATDIDLDTPTFSITGGADAALFSIDTNSGALTFVAAPDFEAPGDADTNNVYEVEVTADDGKGGTDVQTISVTVTDANDVPVIGGTDTGSVTEDVGVVGGNIGTSGSLTIADPDAGESSFQAATVTGTYGDLTIDAAGNWTYSAVNGQAAIQALDAGESLTDTLTVTTFDGTTHDVVITINGAEDAPVIGGTATGSVAEDGTLTASNTLTISDTDTSDNPISFNDVAPTLGANGYGNFEITLNTWTYTLNNGHASVQALDVGETLTDTYTFSASDGSTQIVTVTISGSEDAPVIGGTAAGAVTEDGTLTASDTLTITDADTSDNPISFNDVAPTLGANGYGNFEITSNIWTYTLNNGHASVQALDVGETLTDTYTFTASDGSTQIVTVTINGSEDAPVIGGTATGTVAEDGTLTASNTLTITDTDTSDNPISFNDVAATLGDNGYGNFEITSNTWTYTLNNGHAAVQALDVGESLTDTYTFTASDGSTQVVSVTINGAEDAPVIGGTATGAVTEDGTLTASNTLTITDADSSDNPISFNDVAPTLGDNGYGNFEITGNTWTYTLNNGHAAVQALDVGEALSDTYTFTASDGSTQTVTVTINGAEDAPVIGGTATGAVTEDGTLTASNTLTITDTDTSDNPISFNDVAPTLGDNGYGNFEITSNIWTYTLNNGHASVQALDVGESLTDTYTFTASDGSTQTVTVTINGAEDAPSLDNPIADQNAMESVAYSYTFPANAFGDVDASDSLTYSAALAGGGPLPAWLAFDGPTRTFSGTPGAADVGALDIRVTADDGSSTVDDVFTLTVAPFNNLPVIGGADSGAVTEDRNLFAGQLTESGALSIADPDPGESSFVAATVNGALGTLVIDAAGNWTYSADNGQPEIQALDTGESIADVLTVTTADGTTHDIVITINGVAEATIPPPSQPPAPEPTPEVDEPDELPESEPPIVTGAPAEPPEIVRMPQETIVPERDEPESPAVAEAEPAVTPERPAPQPAQATRTIEISPFGLNIEQLKLHVSDDAAVNDQFEQALQEHIERMHTAMDQDGERKRAEDIEVQVMMGTSLSLTAGIVSWVLRGGSLLASLMSTVPLLNRFDPLPILKSKRGHRVVVVNDDDETTPTDVPRHEKRVDAMFSNDEARPG